MKTIIDHIRMNGKYYEIRAGGINYKYIEANDLIPFIESIVKHNLTIPVQSSILNASVSGERRQ